MKKAYLFCDKRSLNDATIYYVNIVIKCLKLKEYKVDIVHSLNEIKNPSVIFTITNYYFIKAKIKFPLVKTINWKQGVAFEEAKVNRPFYKLLPVYVFEFMSVHFSDIQLFVSEMMNDYYRTHFLYKGNRHVIMPCYNLAFSSSQELSRYKKPSFVYAGGVSKWQSIDVLLDTYSLIEKRIPESKLILYSKDKDFLVRETTKRNIKNCQIKYVPLEQLQSELGKYKYGFILREKNWINYVATPTKMNSYLAAGLIPIFSNGVNDFEKHVKLGEFTIMAKTPLNPEIIAKRIVDFETSSHNFECYSKIVEQLFSEYYNDLFYQNRILSKMENFGI